ncbi:hypothetical protein LCGC14_0591290 [marine sediment metagenome]|uniref:Uncharacterized protein n=1 Tax=marine sediment metagenome TaxID=412755 RepID=A0A0F9RX71_9ZZZZ
MATVPIEVQRYKLIYRVALNALEAMFGEDMAGDFMSDLSTGNYEVHDLPFPDFVCDSCGYANPEGDFEGKVCHRCGKQPITTSQYLTLKTQ